MHSIHTANGDSPDGNVLPHRRAGSNPARIVCHGELQNARGTVSDCTSPFERHLFVCTSGEFCPLLDGNSRDIHQAFKEQVAKAGLKGAVRVNNSGCLDQCGHGPNAVVYPDNVWYSHLTVEDVPVIIQEHLIDGKPVERLRYHPRKPGANKLKRDAGQHQLAGQVDGCRTDWPIIPFRDPDAEGS
jgi:(2Fe-2S) ferredoxin